MVHGHMAKMEFQGKDLILHSLHPFKEKSKMEESLYLDKIICILTFKSSFPRDALIFLTHDEEVTVYNLATMLILARHEMVSVLLHFSQSHYHL